MAVVGAGNSGAQILAEVSAPGVASSALWSTLEEPSFLPMGLSGKEIFDTGKSGRGWRCGGIPKNMDVLLLNTLFNRGIFSF